MRPILSPRLLGAAIVLAFALGTMAVIGVALRSSDAACDPYSALPWLRC